MNSPSLERLLGDLESAEEAVRSGKGLNENHRAAILTLLDVPELEEGSGALDESSEIFRGATRKWWLGAAAILLGLLGVLLGMREQVGTYRSTEIGDLVSKSVLAPKSVSAIVDSSQFPQVKIRCRGGHPGSPGVLWAATRRDPWSMNWIRGIDFDDSGVWESSEILPQQAATLLSILASDELEFRVMTMTSRP